MRKVILFFICSTMLVSSVSHALRFGPVPKTTIPDKQMVKFLPTRNEALEKALTVHNLMTEIPALRVMADQQKELKSSLKEVQRIYDDLKKCNEKRLKRFKNAPQVLNKLKEAYRTRTQNLEADLPYDENSIVPRSLAERSRLSSKKQDIEVELLTDALKNGQKWGGEVVGKKDVSVPENLKAKLSGLGLEDLNMAEDVSINAKQADIDFDRTFKEMQERFVQQLASVGLEFPEFNASRSADIYQVQKALQELKEKYVNEAKEHIAKLDEQDAAYPRAVERRAARTQNKQKVLKQAQADFPEAFSDMTSLDQQTPQQRQQIVVTALEKDKEGSVFLTETNAIEIDQKIAEGKANQAMLQRVQDQMHSYMDRVKTSSPQQNFDFDQCDLS